MKGAVIDLGTNTFNLLIYEKKSKDYTIIYTERQPAALGEGGITTNQITPKAFNRGVKILNTFKKKCDEFSVTRIKAFGTSALRGASNSSPFLKEVAEKTGIQIHIISGEEEAQLIYEGVKHVHEFTEPSCIMDIGGGSTEFILVNEKGCQNLKSFNIGVARILQTYKLSDPLSEQDITNLEAFLAKTTHPFFVEHSCTTLIGASGSFDTFYELLHDVPYENPWQSAILPTAPLLKKLDELISSTLKEREQNPKILDLRKNMIHIAALKTRWVIRQLGIKTIWISPASLKEGVMFSKLDTL